MRLHPRFSLKTLLVIITAFSLWLGLHVRSTRLQREAVKAIQEHDGWVAYDYQFVDSEYDHQANSSVPTWLREFMGDDFFHSVEEVSFWSRYRGKALEVKENPAVLPLQDLLSDVPDIKCLRLWNTQATDQNLEVLANLDCLESLVLLETKGITDKGAVHIKSLKHLKWLVLTESKITDASLQVFAGLPQLEVLNLDGSHLSNEGLTHFAEHRQLRILHLDGSDDRPSEISDDGIIRLCSIPKLTFLGVENTSVTQTGAKAFVATCPKCEVLR